MDISKPRRVLVFTSSLAQISVPISSQLISGVPLSEDAFGLWSGFLERFKVLLGAIEDGSDGTVHTHYKDMNAIAISRTATSPQD